MCCLLQLTLTSAVYFLKMRIFSFNNPGALDATGQCCVQNCSSRCNYFASTCQRPAGSPVSYIPELNQANCLTVDTPTRLLNASHTFRYPVYLFSSNGTQWVSTYCVTISSMTLCEWAMGTLHRNKCTIIIESLFQEENFETISSSGGVWNKVMAIWKLPRLFHHLYLQILKVHTNFH